MLFNLSIQVCRFSGWFLFFFLSFSFFVFFFWLLKSINTDHVLLLTYLIPNKYPTPSFHISQSRRGHLFVLRGFRFLAWSVKFWGFLYIYIILDLNSSTDKLTSSMSSPLIHSYESLVFAFISIVNAFVAFASTIALSRQSWSVRDHDFRYIYIFFFGFSTYRHPHFWTGIRSNLLTPIRHSRALVSSGPWSLAFPSFEPLPCSSFSNQIHPSSLNSVKGRLSPCSIPYPLLQ